MPYEGFDIIKKIGQGGFSKVYEAIWRDGPIWNWNSKSKKWDRNDSCKVALKVLEGSKDSTKFLEEVSAYVECAALSVHKQTILPYDLFLFDNYGELSVKNDEIFESKYEIHPGAIYTSRELSIYTQSLSQDDDEMIEWNTEKRLEVPGSNYYTTKLQNMNDEFGNNLNN
ncbi:unnamed protein product [Rhizophagus irregularis]|nr:unnamed protein product [Rhizophagus irregularis]